LASSAFSPRFDRMDASTLRASSGFWRDHSAARVDCSTKVRRTRSAGLGERRRGAEERAFGGSKEVAMSASERSHLAGVAGWTAHFAHARVVQNFCDGQGAPPVFSRR
jgi:hypothetical protein